jgi:hypothetical protein
MKEYTKAKEIIESLRTIPDYRVDIGKIKHLLVEVLFTVIFTLLKGNTKFKEIYGWFIIKKTKMYKLGRSFCFNEVKKRGVNYERIYKG